MTGHERQVVRKALAQMRAGDPHSARDTFLSLEGEALATCLTHLIMNVVLSSPYDTASTFLTTFLSALPEDRLADRLAVLLHSTEGHLTDYLEALLK